MNALRLLPVMISFALLAAHFFRAGFVVMAGISIIFPCLLLLKKTWVLRLVQAALFLGALEWLRSLYFLVQQRIEWGQPWLRLAVILGAVVLFTLLSALVFETKSLRKRYRR